MESEKLAPTTSVIITAVVMVGLIVMLSKARYHYRRLPKLPVVDGSGAETVTAIIPARKEAANIERSVRSLTGARVIVVDDFSDDGTAELAAAAGAQVIPAPKLFRGQLGKPNACQAGAKLADTTYLLFTDADVTYDPKFAASIARYADENDFFLVSPMLGFEGGSLLDWTLAPYARGLQFAGVNSSKAQDFMKPEILVNGQSMLMLRQSYEFIGGHRSVISFPADDHALTARVKRHRMKLQIVRGEHLGKARMDNTLGSLRRLFRNRKPSVQTLFTALLLASLPPLMVWLALDKQYWMILLAALLPPYLLAQWYGGLLRALLWLPASLIYPVIALTNITAGSLDWKTDWKGRKV